MLISFLQNNIVKIFFKLTIFALLIIQLTQLVKEYLLPVLRKHIANAEQFLKDLKDKTSLLKGTKKRITSHIKEQKKSFETLEDKVKTWHKARAKNQKNKKETLKHTIKKLTKKREQQYAYIQEQQIKERIVPQAIQQARETLEKTYASNKHILTKVIDEL